MVFDRLYAEYYDMYYREKNYAAECDMIERLFAKRGVTPSTILDLGCGTGRHAVLLAKRGFEVTGVDRSQQMLDIASGRIEKAGFDIPLHRQEIQALDTGSQYGAAIAMFDVIGYLCSNQTLMGALRRILDHLHQGGLFIFDCWYGPAVLAHRPQPRLHRYLGPADEHIVRLATPQVDPLRQIVDVEYELLVISDKKVVSSSHETHRMRYFHPMELHLSLETCGFSEVEIGAFLHPEVTPTGDDWNVVVSARRPINVRSG